MLCTCERLCQTCVCACVRVYVVLCVRVRYSRNQSDGHALVPPQRAGTAFLGGHDNRYGHRYFVCYILNNCTACHETQKVATWSYQYQYSALPFVCATESALIDSRGMLSSYGSCLCLPGRWGWWRAWRTCRRRTRSSTTHAGCDRNSRPSRHR